MAKAKNWIYTSLAEDNALILEMDGVEYKMSSITMSFGLNGVPKATLALASGRNTRTREKAKIHDNADELTQMIPAKVRSTISGEFDASGKMWPGGATEIFDGYFMGWSMRKFMGKIQIVAELVHWLIDLQMSTALNSLTHPSSPASLLRPAVTGTTTRGGNRKVIFMPKSAGIAAMNKFLPGNLWGAMKSYFCGLMDWAGVRLVPRIGCTGIDFKQNDRGKKALARIEGPSDCPGNIDHDISKELSLRIRGLDVVKKSIRNSLVDQSLKAATNNTMWDVLVGRFLPQFAMDIMPLADRALAIASLPSWRGEGGDDGYWREIGANEYVVSNQRSAIPKPVKAMAVYSRMESYYGSKVKGPPYVATVGGCFGSDAREDSDGTIMLIAPPPWIKNLTVESLNVGKTTGLRERKKINDESSPGSGTKSDDPPPDQVVRTSSDFLTDFAQAEFSRHSLRGRFLEITGKLRFDIAPGSHVVVAGSSELFLGGVDVLASDVIGYVQAVTVTIDAEARNAYTSFRLTHTRSQEENTKNRSSLESHPLFEGKAMIKGAALVQEYAFDE
jgi:hypothetical protein